MDSTLTDTDPKNQRIEIVSLSAQISLDDDDDDYIHVFLDHQDKLSARSQVMVLGLLCRSAETIARKIAVDHGVCDTVFDDAWKRAGKTVTL